MAMMTLYARQQKDTGVYSGLLDSEGEGGMIWENGIETCILSCKKRIASLCLMQDAWKKKREKEKNYISHSL